MLSGQANGQTAQPGASSNTRLAAAAADQPAAEVEEITVTARRTSEPLQKVPISITAFTPETLKERAIYSAYGLNSAVPGLTVESNSGDPALPAFSIRGRGLNYGAATGSVEIYLADVPLSGPYQAPYLPPQLFDLQSVQVLKGPQGTLFGRNTTGGAVLLVPQAPTYEFGGYGRLQGGDYGDFQAEGALNLPLIADKLAVRLAIFDWQRDGYMHALPAVDNLTGKQLGEQTYGNIDTKEVRLTIRTNPVDGVESSTLLTYHWDQVRESSGPGLTLTWSGCAPGVLYLACPPGGTPSVAPTPGEGTRYGPGGIDLTKPATKVWAAINTTTVDLNESLKVKNILGYIHASGYTDDATDAGGAGAAALLLPVPNRPRENRQITEELQLQGHNLEDRLTWIVGGLGDFTREPRGLTAMNITSNVLFGPFNPAAPLYSNAAQTFGAENDDTYALFGSVTYKLTDQLNATAGYRHSWNKFETLIANTQPGYSGILSPTFPLNRFEGRDGGDTYNLGLDYQLTADSLLYGGYRHGFKRAGFNPAADPPHAAFGPEKVDDFYIGLKNNFHVAGMPLRFNIEGYYDLYKDEQVTYIDFDTTTFQILSITTNVPKTTFRGFDAELALSPTGWLTVSASYSLIDAFNTKWQDNSMPGQTQDLSSNPVVFVSKNKVNVTTRLHRDLPGGLGEVVVQPTVSYQDKFYTSPFGSVTPFGQQLVFGPLNQIALGAVTVPAYTTVDLRAEWNQVWGSKVDLGFNAGNLTNKVYYLGDNANLGIGIQGHGYGPPRMYTFEVSTRF
jgi:iron complex outermembrane receptor protein